MASPLELEYNKGYKNIIFFFGHNEIVGGERSVSLIPVPQGLCVVNINPIGEIASYAQVKAFYDFAKIDTKGLLYDPARNKGIIEHSVNLLNTGKPIELSIAIGPMHTTPEMKGYPYADLQGTTDTAGNLVADITLSGIYTMGSLLQTTTFDPIYPNNGNITWEQIMGCYQGSISPTITQLTKIWQKTDGRNLTDLGSQPKAFWDPFFSSFNFNTQELFKNACSLKKRTVFYNLGCRVLSFRGTTHIARRASINQANKISKAFAPQPMSDRRMRKKYRKTRRKNRKNRK